MLLLYVRLSLQIQKYFYNYFDITPIPINFVELKECVMKYIGVHVDSLVDIARAPAIAAGLGARAFALSVADPARWKSPAIPQEQIDGFKQSCLEYGFSSRYILPHGRFVVNLGSPESFKLKLSRESMIDEMRRVQSLGLTMLNFHPGAHLKKITEDESIKRVCESLNIVLDQTEGVTAVIENTAGQGSNLGYSFEHIARIIEGVDDKTRVGVCIDTAHAYAAGYNLAAEDSYDDCWTRFGQLIGFEYLRGMHINDSIKPLGSRVDRHASIGAGLIGEAFFHRLMQDGRFDNIPLILETPDPGLWQQEVAKLYAFEQNS